MVMTDRELFSVGHCAMNAESAREEIRSWTWTETMITSIRIIHLFRIMLCQQHATHHASYRTVCHQQWNGWALTMAQTCTHKSLLWASNSITASARVYAHTHSHTHARGTWERHNHHILFIIIIVNIIFFFIIIVTVTFCTRPTHTQQCIKWMCNCVSILRSPMHNKYRYALCYAVWWCGMAWHRSISRIRTAHNSHTPNLRGLTELCT